MGAILRLSQEHPVSALIPMITLEEDVQRMRDVFDKTSVERQITHPPQFGAMIETPAAALAVPAILKHADFLCVGTNDLTQYTLAAARDDASVNAYYQDSHESVMRLLQIVLADANGRPVTLCGELAGRQKPWCRTLVQMGFLHAERGTHSHPPHEGSDSRGESRQPGDGRKFVSIAPSRGARGVGATHLTG